MTIAMTTAIGSQNDGDDNHHDDGKLSWSHLPGAPKIQTVKGNIDIQASHNRNGDDYNNNYDNDLAGVIRNAQCEALGLWIARVIDKHNVCC